MNKLAYSHMIEYYTLRKKQGGSLCTDRENIYRMFCKVKGNRYRIAFSVWSL